VTGFWRQIADRLRSRRRPTPSPARVAFAERARNELAQVRAIRDDCRVARGGSFDQWLAGVIFALEWVVNPESSVPPSAPAAKIRAGISAESVLPPPPK
jgi:hypothetical protein